MFNLHFFLNFYQRNEIKEKMQARYIKNPDYSYEKINRASVACGPLVKWAIAQVSFRNFKHFLL